MTRKGLALFSFVSACLLALCAALPATAQQLPAPERIQAPVSPMGGQVDRAPEVLPYRADRVLVQFTPGAAATLAGRPGPELAAGRSGIASVDALNRDHGVREMARKHEGFGDPALASRLGLDRWYRVELSGPADAEAVAARYRANPNVEAATPDYRAFPSAVPNDPLYPDQWGHNNTAQMLDYCWGCGGHPAGSPVGTPGFDSNAQAAWDEATGYGSSSVIIAILDSGVDAGHPDLNQMAGYDFGDNDNNPDDDSASPGHGTACAGVAAAISNNGVGVSGIAGGSTIMPLKVADSGGSLFFSYIQDALVYAGDNGADIASMSFGAGITSDPATDSALQYAYDRGVTLLSSTGNNNASQIGYPAIHPLVIGVGAASPCGERKRSSSSPFEVNPGVSTDPNGYTCDGERWWGSSYGPNIQDAAGAVDVIAPTIMPTTDIQGSGGYDSSDYSMWFNGTSCSAPYAAGVAALIKAANPSFTPAQVRDKLVSTAQDVTGVESGAGWDRYSGYGMVDAAAAVAGQNPVPPVAEFSGSPTSGNVPVAVSFTDLSTNNPTSWSWDFGDGNTSTAQNPSHTYTTAGSFTVTLTVSNAAGSDGETKVGYINTTDLNPPVADFSGTPTSGDVPLAVSFTDLSTNSPTSWSWDFGDGNTSTAQNPSHTYQAAGSYTVSLTATNADGSDSETKVDYITASDPGAPVLRYAQSDIVGAGSVSGTYLATHSSDDNRQVLTERESGGKPANRHSYGEHRWTFNVAAGNAVSFHVEAFRSDNSEGDDFAFEYSTNNSSFTPMLTVASSTEQSYSATLPPSLSGTVYVRVVDTDQGTGNRNLDSVHIDQMYFETLTSPVTNPPVADFTAAPTSGSAPLEVVFTDQSTNTPNSWSWDFGDGNTSTTQNPTHVYSSAGTYTVSLTASNSVGSDSVTKIDYITVTPPTQTVLHVSNIVVTRETKGPNTNAVANVTVVNASGSPVANATVVGFFSAPDNSSFSATTGANGVATLKSNKSKNFPANACFEVTDVSLSGATYDPGSNVWTRRCEDGSGFSVAGELARRGQDGLQATPSSPARTSLDTNHPNPFNPRTELRFRLAAEGPVRLEVFDAVGRRVAVLVDGPMPAGDHTRSWDATGLHSGIYFARLVADGQQFARKMILVK